MELDLFPDDARVWVFTSNKSVNVNVQKEIASPVLSFLEQWATHGKALTATGAWLNDFQLAIVLDESKVGASGCSIDALTRFMRELGERYTINWFDRMVMLIEEDGELRQVPFQSLSNYPKALLFDSLVQRLGEIRSDKWPVPLSESRYKQVI